MIRVAVAGALGRLGRVASAALEACGDQVAYAGGYARRRVPEQRIVDDLEELFAGGVDVLLDVTTYPSTVEISTTALRSGVRPVIGATGWKDDDIARLAEEAETRGLGAMLVPNFSLVAALAIRFAQEAAAFFPAAEIIELHHDGKKDMPSGTSRLTAQRIEERLGGKRVPIHSVRLPGLLAHQEVLFGAPGELLTIRHDTLSRDSFVPGMLAAVRAVTHLQALVIGLDSILPLRQAPLRQAPLRQAQGGRGGDGA